MHPPVCCDKIARQAGGLLKLIKGEWWLAPTKLTTDANGQVSFAGFLGDYEVSLDRQPVAFAVTDKGEAHVTLEV
jgi:hypothetical protein